MRSIFFIGVAQFPIAVSRAVEARLRERPVVVAASNSPRARCLSVSTEARQLGVRLGMRLSDARRHSRDLTIISPDPVIYQRAAAAIEKVVKEFTPLYEPAQSGCVYLDLTGTNRLFGGPIQAADRIKRSILNDLKLTADGGIASNKLVSRVAAIDASPAGLVEVEQGGEAPFLAPHRVSVLPLVNGEVRLKLNELNINLVEQVNRLDVTVLEGVLGLTAHHLKRQANGIDPAPVIPAGDAPVIVSRHELEEDTNERSQLERELWRMLLEVMERLNRQRLTAGRMKLQVDFSDGKRAVESLSLRRSAPSSTEWVKLANELLKRATGRRVRVKALELSLSELTIAVEQLELLLEGTKALHSSRRRMDAALSALFNVRDRFGDKALSMGVEHVCRA